MKFLVLAMNLLLLGAGLVQGQSIEKPANSQPAEVAATIENGEESAAKATASTQQESGKQ